MIFGKATYRKGKLYFDDHGWKMVMDKARKIHKTPTQVVNAALLRSVRKGLFNAKEG